MKLIGKIVIFSSVAASFAVQAAVEVNLHRDIEPIVLEGKEVGFSLSKKDKVVLPNGTNQIVIRVAKLVEKKGEREKFNSKPQVFTITASDAVLFLSPEMKITRFEQAEVFEQEPTYSLESKDGSDVEYTYETLPPLSGITRDYVKELRRYNEQNNMSVEAPSNDSLQNMAPHNSVKPQAQEMVEYWFTKASKEDKELFIDWAFSNRTQISPKSLEGTKELEMMAHWYQEATPETRKELLSWSLAQ